MQKTERERVIYFCYFQFLLCQGARSFKSVQSGQLTKLLSKQSALCSESARNTSQTTVYIS